MIVPYTVYDSTVYGLLISVMTLKLMTVCTRSSKRISPVSLVIVNLLCRDAVAAIERDAVAAIERDAVAAIERDAVAAIERDAVAAIERDGPQVTGR